MIRVLLVDDEYYFRQSMKALVDWSELGFEVVDEATNGLDAINKAASADLVFLDINIPKFNGLQVLEECVKREYHAKIVIVTVYSEFSYIKQAIAHGAIDFLLKPLEKDDLLRVLHKTKRIIDQANNSPINIRKQCKGTFFSDHASGSTLSFVSKQRLDLLILMRSGCCESVPPFLNALFENKTYCAEDLYLLMMEIISVCKEFCIENNCEFNQEEIYTSAVNTLRNALHLNEITSWMSQLIIEKIQQSEQIAGKVSRSRRVVEDVKKYIEANYTDAELSVASISKAFFLNYHYLSKIFNQHTGIGMNKYIAHIRTQKAKELLDEGCCSIQRVANKVGFSDVDYFSKCFKKVFGRTPSQYLEQSNN